MHFAALEAKFLSKITLNLDENYYKSALALY